MKIAVQMDHISTIHITGDTTFALCLEAQLRGHTLFHYTPDRLSMRDGRVFAQVEALTVRDKTDNHYILGQFLKVDLSEMDVILLRQDPPFNMHYITTTYMLERLSPKTMIINDPAAVRNHPEKIFVTEFSDLIPETLITKNLEDIAAFHREFGDVVLKPLYNNGGSCVFYITRHDCNFPALLEMFRQMFCESFIVQRYLKSVLAGDKRIILVNGEPAGAINRIPPDGDIRSNMHVGGCVEKTDLTEREYEICTRIGSSLKKRGLILVGIDVIGGYMTEINVTSPTGIREIKRFGGKDIAALFWDIVEDKVML
ncbi:MAG: glutathione synthase [Candidatus Tokpelaia sp. JSC085]|nr:MAG: glutathione synthase [Candidatus Tokpelaia sp. JSC085]